jgi:hypothetical protein
MYWNRARSIQEILLTATRSDAAVFGLVSYTDGGIGIARDGKPLTSFYWKSGELDECMETFMRLAGLELTGGLVASDAN